MPHIRSYTRDFAPYFRRSHYQPQYWCRMATSELLCYADKSETIDALKDNILEAIDETQRHTIDNVLKNCTDHVEYYMARRGQPFEWNYFPLLIERIVLSNKKRNLRKYSFFFKVFSKKKRYLADPVDWYIQFAVWFFSVTHVTRSYQKFHRKEAI